MVLVAFARSLFSGLRLILLGLGLQLPLVRWLLNSFRQRRLIWLGAAASWALIVAGYLLEFQRVLRLFPAGWWTWLECALPVETIWLIGFSLALLLWRATPRFSPARRWLLQTAAAGLCVAPMEATAVLRSSITELSFYGIPLPPLFQRKKCNLCLSWVGQNRPMRVR